MTVLFVCREKGDGKISPITKAQANSLNALADVRIFSIKGRGWKAYLRGIIRLTKYLRTNQVDLIHAHYSYSGYVASLASRKTVICSLMGSDIEDFWLNRILIRFFNRFFWKAVIVKSQNLKEKIKIPQARVIPNGIDLELFKPETKSTAREKVGFDPSKRIILFLADPSRPEKNYALAQEAYDLLNNKKHIELKANA